MRLYFHPKHKDAKIFENHLYPVLREMKAWLDECKASGVKFQCYFSFYTEITRKTQLNGIHWKAVAVYCQMNSHVPGFQSFFSFSLHHFVIAKLEC